MKTVVYGIGDNFSRNYKWITDSFEVVGLVDGAPEKEGRVVCGLPIHRPMELPDMIFDKILITPNVYPQIKKILLDMGIPEEKMLSLVELLKPDLVGNQLKMCFRSIGGMGDQLIAINYIYCLLEKYHAERMKVDVICVRGAGFLQSIFKGCNQINIIAEDDITQDKMQFYDLIIEIRRYPKIMKADMNKISRILPPLVDYLLTLEKFKIFHPRYFLEDFVADGGSATLEVIEGKKRIQQPDVYKVLEMTEKYMCPIAVNKEALASFQLKTNGYITIHRGCEEKNFSSNSVKLWPITHYNRLIPMLRELFPDKQIIFIGAEGEREQGIEGVDKNLAGKTSVEELKALLKYSFLHIDSEGGMVHLRHALQGDASAVLYGPTSDAFYGYEENINIRTKSCAYPCEWAILDWNVRCLREKEQRICMSSITPEMVIRRLKKWIER